MMSNNLTTTGNLPAIKADASVSLVDIRKNPEAFPRLRNYPREEAIAQMAKIVLQAFMYRGQQADMQNVNFISSNLVDELMQETQHGASYISFLEISRCVKKAILGGSEVFGISVSSLYKIILDYVKGEGLEASRMAKKQRREEERKLLESHPINIMLRAKAGEIISRNKSNK